MKNLLPVFLLTSFGVFGQTAPKLKTVDCNAEQKTAFSKDVKESDEVTIKITFLDSTNGADAKTKYKLIFKQNSNKDIAPESSEKLTFKLGKPFQGRKENELTYQLVSADLKTCYDFLIQLTKIKDENRDSKVPPLNLSELPKDLSTPCEVCGTPARIVRYDFPENRLTTIWPYKKPNNERNLFRRFSRGLPRVGIPFTFEVARINPFRFDVSVEYDATIFDREVPEILTLSFTPPTGIKAAAKLAEKPSDLENAVLEELGVKLTRITEALKNAGDCYDPCEYVLKVDEEIKKYFATKPFEYKYNESLEAFLTRELNIPASPDEKDKERVAKLTSTIAMYTTFRLTRSGTIRWHVPQTQNADFYSFKLNITPKAGVTSGARVVNQEIQLDVLGGFHIDPSAGLFITDLIDDKFSLRKDSLVETAHNGADSVIRWKDVVRENGNKQDFGIGALFHFYPKLTKSVNIGFSLGAGATLNEKPKLRYLVGSSLLLGRENRLALTYGWALGYIDKLSNRYQTNAAGELVADFKDSEVAVRKVFHSKPFFSVTYNIPVGRKKKDVKAEASSSDSEGKGKHNSDKQAKTTNKDDGKDTATKEDQKQE